MNRIEKTVAITTIFTFTGGVLAWVHTHAEESVEKRVAPAKALAEMNRAEIKLYTIERDIKFIKLVPKDKRDEYETDQLKYLAQEKAWWSQRVKELETGVK